MPIKKLFRKDRLSGINALFDRYKDSDADEIGPVGVMKMCDELEINPLDINMLIFAWVLRAHAPCRFSREEWTSGLQGLEVGSGEELKAKIASLGKLIEDEVDFRNFYVFAFAYNKDPDQKSLPLDTAKALWGLILEGRFEHLALWLEFLETKTHSIPKDTYVLLLEFVYSINSDFTNYDENSTDRIFSRRGFGTLY
eukprot:CAMPEP_0174892222 /NCGR_PEP_ID=MMETSP0167-20121228/7216_1 /TAXON_ID=38298 /ORGANISM="Rhodella maculata, Strain CCMP736" /LENGTH=196 /DNA_ID=CAMNT_0016130653 /DNA_START=150 /DNA_END=740 /DNA_ORIENTATION=-